MTDEQRKLFLNALEHEGAVGAACRTSGVTRRMALDERDRDAKFAHAWQAAEQAAIAQVEQVAISEAAKPDGDRRMKAFMAATARRRAASITTNGSALAALHGECLLAAHLTTDHADRTPH